MEELKQKILTCGRVEESNILKVDSFLNHQIDVGLMERIGKEFYRRFSDKKVDKVLTVEASGIAPACFAAVCFGVPVVFAKKSESFLNTSEFYEKEVFSYTKNKIYIIRVAKKYLLPNENILVIDDFLANGEALLAVDSIIKEARAFCAGAGIVVEKGFQKGRQRAIEAGIRLESLAVIQNMENGKIII